MANIPYPITQPFGNYNPAVEKFSRGINYGADIGTPVGTPVSVPQGKWNVSEAYAGANSPGYIGSNVNRGYGNSVLLKNADTGEKLRFSHLSQTPLQQGQTFGGGVVGKTGATGNVTGPHLDLEYYNKAGQLADVMATNYVNSIFGGSGGPIQSPGQPISPAAQAVHQNIKRTIFPMLLSLISYQPPINTNVKPIQKKTTRTVFPDFSKLYGQIGNV